MKHTPEISEHEKLLLFLDASTPGTKRVLERVTTRAPGLLTRLASPRSAVSLMSALAIDPFRAISKAAGYQITIEMESDAGRGALSDSAAWLLRELGDEVDPSEAAVVIGRDYVFRRCSRQPVRFQYLMRRRSDFTHEAYSKRYAEVHSVFGMKTRGNEGYVQCHIDPAASREVAERTGCGCWDFDSVAQLDLKSMARFFAVAPYNATLGGLGDEKKFIDRAASPMFVSKTIGAWGRSHRATPGNI